MNAIKNNKMLIAGLLAIGLLSYFYWGYMGSSGEVLLTETSVETASPVSDVLVATLGSLNVIRLDDSIFKDPVFASLTDFGIVLPPQEVGRRNPFAPASGAAAQGAASQ